MAIIGIDIGGSGIKAAPVDVRAGQTVHERVRVATPQPSTVDSVLDCIDEVVTSIQKLPNARQLGISRTSGIGVTFPGVILHGEVRTAANVDHSWIGVDLATLLKERLRRRAVVLNDADAAGLAEIHHGAARGVQGVVIVLTFGTGIGSGLFVDGRLVPNTELGHLEWHGKDAESRAAASVREARGWSWQKWAERAGEYIDMVSALFSPELVVIGGGVANRADKWIHDLHTKVRCVPAALGNEAGIIGAATAAAKGARR